MRHLSLKQLSERARQRTWIIDLRDLKETTEGMLGQLVYIHHDVVIGVNFRMQGADVRFDTPPVFVEAAGIKGAKGRRASKSDVEQTLLEALDMAVVARDVRERLEG
ncbi:hypothetical protein CAI21_15280 [Alkalilimnicola ehrlichii]|uniref:Uncharacterized protein n=1 Tax=Alkalilimnicola ehrlichii TaxID=351052 RepID=A0A3E0WTA3_9GAMM|nr:hypothetical protein [Alkalilimnicola ehrlichii]RFA27208.1 hypothetical protein CAI21_15280 [Alkalilimnicola ehrlichii]RFA35381.1 hypothetical protein CAL65_12945 [Alkalilimnicola ehrlichii]